MFQDERPGQEQGKDLSPPHAEGQDSPLYPELPVYNGDGDAPTKSMAPGPGAAGPPTAPIPLGNFLSSPTFWT